MIRLLAYLWVGLVFGVSFVATPVKFRAESLTLPVALDVGRATFHALGRIEWVLSAALLALFVRAALLGGLDGLDWALAVGAIVIVAAQALWLIPRLDIRVESVIAGDVLPRSQLHLVFVGFEFTKMLLLLGIGGWTGGHA
jgi:hypothetical protein